MYQSVGFCDFTDAFRKMDRKENFSYEGLKVLFDYLERLEEDMGEPIELDVIALCCEYMEIEDDEEAYAEYVGDEATREDYVIEKLPCSVLVRQS